MCSQDATYSARPRSCRSARKAAKWPVITQKISTYNILIVVINPFVYLTDFTIAEFEEKASADFMRALSELPTEQMHKLYIAFCMERLKLNSKFLNEEVNLSEFFQIINTLLIGFYSLAICTFKRSLQINRHQIWSFA